MQAIHDSYVYYIYEVLRSFFARQWRESGVVRWLTHQRANARDAAIAGWSGKFRRGLSALFRKLHLDRILQGSIFLHPLLFASLAIILAPLCPTTVILALVCAGFFSLILRFGVDEQQRITKSPLNGYVVAYAAIYLYATFTSTSVSGSLMAGMLTIPFVLFFFLVTSCGLDARKIRLLLTVMVWVGALIALYGFYQRLFPSKFRSVWTDTDMFSDITFRVYATLENPNVLGEYFLLVIPLAAGMMLTSEGIVKKLLYLAICGVMSVCLVLTYSRGCYLGLLFAVAIFLVLLDRRFLVLGIIALVLCPLYLPASVLDRFTSIGNMGDTSTSYRVYIWMGTLAMLKDYWFCGIGPGAKAFNVIYPHYAYNAITAPHSHNLYLQIACDTGVCGIVLFLAMLVSYFRMMFTAIHLEEDRTAKIFQISGVSAVVGFLVQSMTDYTFYNYRVMLLFWVLLALSVLFTRMGHPKAEAEAAK